MRSRLMNIPFYTVMGLISIFYIAIFFNFNEILASAFASQPVGFNIGLYSIILVIPLAGKAGIIYRDGHRSRLRFIFWYSIGILLIFTLLASSFLNDWWQHAILSDWFSKYHKTIIGSVSAALCLLIFSFVSDALDAKSFLASIQKFPMVSPVFCFGAPAFWHKSLKQIGFNADEISFLGGISVVSGVIFLSALLIYFLAKHMRESPIAGVNNFEKKQIQLIKSSLILNFVGFSMLLFVCFDISYLTFKHS